MAILFDLDGTLLDTSQDFNFAINKILQARGSPPADYAKIRSAISYGSRHIIATAFNLEHLSSQEHDQYIEELLPIFLEHYQASGFKDTMAFPGIDGLLDSLDEANITWGIVTNKYRALTEPLLKHTGYFQRSACVVCGDTTPNPKPAPDPLLHACKLLKIDPSTCIYIGDAQTDIQAGKAAGMKTIAAAFGFVPENIDINTWQSDAIAHTPHDILPWINKWIKTTN